MSKKIPVIGMCPGDHAGIGPEIMAKTLAKTQENFIPVVVANRSIFEASCKKHAPFIYEKYRFIYVDENYPVFDQTDALYLVDVAAGPDIHFGERTLDSGKLAVDSMCKAIALRKAGKIDGLYVAPNTKECVNMASPDIDSEFALYDREFDTGDICVSVIKRGPIFTARATAHCALRTVLEQVTVDQMVRVGEDLIATMKKFGAEGKGIVFSGINKWTEEDGFLGDEEEKIIVPAIKIMQERYPDIPISGPYPPQFAALKQIDENDGGGIGYLYHDQGSAIIKAWANREKGRKNIEEMSVVIYTHIPCRIISSGHGSALDIADKGIADIRNTEYALHDLLTMVQYDLEHGITC